MTHPQSASNSTPALHSILGYLGRTKVAQTDRTALSGRTIAHVVSTVYSKEGVNTYVVHLLGRLAARNPDLTLLVFYEYGVSGQTDQVAIGTSRIVFISFRVSSTTELTGALDRYRQESAGGIDLLISQVPFLAEGLASSRYARAKGIAFAAYSHAGPAGLSAAEESTLRTTLTLQAGTRVLAVSEASRQKIIVESGLDLAVDLVGPIIGIEHFEPLDPSDPDERNRVAALRRQLRAGEPDALLVFAPNSFIPRKQPLELIRAVDALIHQGHRQLRLAFVGHLDFPSSAPLLQETLQFLSARGLQGHVFFSPPVEQPALRTFYAAADIVVLPSRSESFGLVLAEAGLMGKPVVAYDRPGMREVVQQRETGLLAPWDDTPVRRIAGLGETIGELIRDAALRERLGAAARPYILGKYSPDRLLPLHEGAYARSLERH